MDPGLLDVLHDTADDDVAGVVADGVDVDLGGFLEEAVDQHRTLGRQATLATERAEPGQLLHRPDETVVVVDDLHGPTAEHVARAEQGRVADAVDDGPGTVEVGGGAAGRLGDLELGAEPVPLVAVLGEVDRVGAGAQHQPSGRTSASLSGVWPPRLTMTPSGGPRPARPRRSLSASSRVSGSKYRRSEVS